MPPLSYKSGSNPPADTLLTAADPRRELLERILASSAFAKSERLSSLLMYICDQTFVGRAKELNEQMVGEVVFDRPLDYDSAIDGIVRTQASRLRKRLELYFDGEGANEPMRIVIPRGGYIPLFEPRTFVEMAQVSSHFEPDVTAVSTTALSSNSVAANLELAHAAARRSWSLSLAWSLVVLLAISLLAIFFHDRSTRGNWQGGAPPDRSLSLPIFSPEVPTLIVPSDCGLVISEASLNRDVGLAEYLRGDYLRAESKKETTPEMLASDLRRRRYTSIVDLQAVESLSQIARYKKSKFEVRFARDVRPNDFKKGNVILLGAAQGNPWVDLFEHSMNFVISKDWRSGTFSVLNRFPQGNEARQWQSSFDGDQPRVYGIVAFLPNPGGTGNALLLEGTSMVGTECAWDFVSDDSQLGPFLKRILRPDGTLPHFELLLESGNMSGSALKGNILAWRIVR